MFTSVLRLDVLTWEIMGTELLLEARVDITGTAVFSISALVYRSEVSRSVPIKHIHY